MAEQERARWAVAVERSVSAGTAEDLARFEELVDRLGRIRDEEREALAELEPLVVRLRERSAGAPRGLVEREALAERAAGPWRVTVDNVRKWLRRIEAQGASGASSHPAS
ncbi:hypothetical protein [Nonomuraea sp. LPB2021202275-12-8]|uniref:hypothetical protein n=1 Tax=Nonomuraea sp. LPB2021202275-12-8 TaxID=3120159 RepID=UPI00300C03EE